VITGVHELSLRRRDAGRGEADGRPYGAGPRGVGGPADRWRVAPDRGPVAVGGTPRTPSTTGRRAPRPRWPPGRRERPRRDDGGRGERQARDDEDDVPRFDDRCPARAPVPRRCTAGRAHGLERDAIQGQHSGRPADQRLPRVGGAHQRDLHPAGHGDRSIMNSAAHCSEAPR